MLIFFCIFWFPQSFSMFSRWYPWYVYGVTMNIIAPKLSFICNSHLINMLKATIAKDVYNFLFKSVNGLHVKTMFQLFCSRKRKYLTIFFFNSNIQLNIFIVHVHLILIQQSCFTKTWLKSKVVACFSESYWSFCLRYLLGEKRGK